MPEFIFDTLGQTEDGFTFSDLDLFTQGYIEALFFTSEGPEEGELGNDTSFADLAPEALAMIRRDCTEFQAEHANLLEEAFARDYDEAQAGRDFWFTRNGHGVGYWDRGPLEADALGGALTEAAHDAGSIDAYLGDDGLVYLS